MLGVYGVSNVTADLKQHTPNLQSVAVLASPWNPQPAGYLQLRTGKYLRKKGFLSIPGSGQYQEDTCLHTPGLASLKVLCTFLKGPTNQLSPFLAHKPKLPTLDLLEIVLCGSLPSQFI